MTRKMIFVAALLLTLCACAPEQPVSSADSAVPASSVLSSEPSAEIPVLEHDGVALRFIEPDEPYDILATTDFGGGYAVVYQQAMPDCFNKIYSRDDIFYNISTQLFAAGGDYLKTVDSLWHNAGKITEPLLRLTPHSDTITFEIWRENEARQTEVDCFTLAITEAGEKALGDNPNHYLYSYHQFYKLAADGQTQLQFTTAYDAAKGRELLKFRLAAPVGPVEELTLPMIDTSFLGALYHVAQGDENASGNQTDLYALETALDVRAKTATLSNGKMTCRLGFGEANPGYSVIRSYTDAMLGKRLSASPDGQYQLYTADEREYFESPNGCDYVVKGPQGIVFLYAGSELDQLYFLDNGRILVNTFDSLRFYDPATGAVLSPGPQFDFGAEPNPYNKSLSGPGRLVVGTAVDAANRVILIAHRPYTFGSGVLNAGTEQQTYELPVTLLELDWDGQMLGERYADMKMRAFAKYSINVVSIALDGDGVATLSCGDQPPVQIRYHLETAQPPSETQEDLL